MAKHSLVLFDLDGTLTDPAEGICGCVQYALKKYGMEPGPIESYHKWIGPPLRFSFENFAGIPSEDSLKLVDYYRERYSQIGLFENTPYSGICELLKELKLGGAKIAVATGKPTVFSVKICEKYGFLPFIDCVSGITLETEPETKADVIRYAMKQLGFSDQPDKCVMIGDRRHDAEGARLVGIDFIGVLYGYGTEEELRTEGAEVFAASVDELCRILL